MLKNIRNYEQKDILLDYSATVLMTYIRVFTLQMVKSGSHVCQTGEKMTMC